MGLWHFPLRLMLKDEFFFIVLELEERKLKLIEASSDAISRTPS